MIRADVVEAILISRTMFYVGVSPAVNFICCFVFHVPYSSPPVSNKSAFLFSLNNALVIADKGEFIHTRIIFFFFFSKRALKVMAEFLAL